MPAKLRYAIYFCVACFTMMHTTAYAQSFKTLDSLKALLKAGVEDHTQVNLFNKIAYGYSTSDSANTFLFASRATTLAQILNYKAGIARANEAKANYFLYKTNPQKALSFLEPAAVAWLSLKDEVSYAGALQLKAQAHFLMIKYTEALELLQEAERIYARKNDKPGLLAVYHTMGSVYSDKGEKETAIDYLLRALKLQEESGNFVQTRSTQNNLGRILADLKNYPEALKYYNQSMSISVTNSDWRNLGITQVNIANIFVNQKNYDLAVDYLTRALANFKKVDFKRGMQTCYNNLGAINLRIEKYTEAIASLNTALGMAGENPAKTGVALIEQNIGYGYAGKKNYTEALKWYTQAEATATNYGADPFTYGEIYNHRASLDSVLKNYQSAFEYRTRFVTINDKLLNEKISRQILEMQTRYETDKKEFRINILSKSDSIKTLQISNQQIDINRKLLLISRQRLSLLDADLQIANDSLHIFEQNTVILQNRFDSAQRYRMIQDLNRQRHIQSLEISNKSLEVAKKNSIIATIGLLMLLVILFGYAYYKKRSLQHESAMQVALSRQQEAATIAILTAEEKERKRIASDLHDGVGQLMTAAWLNLQAMNDRVSSENNEYSQLVNKTMLLVNEGMKEVRAVSHNMMPNALLKKGLVNAIREFINQLDSNIISINLQAEGLQKPLTSHTETILYRVIQECVNNVIKHAGASHLDISINHDGSGIDILIEDNGNGFNVEDALRKENGLGLLNIQSRIKYLHGTVGWDSSHGNGTVVAISIPPAVA